MWHKLGILLEMIKFKHSVFALPFALANHSNRCNAASIQLRRQHQLYHCLYRKDFAASADLIHHA